MEGRVSRILNAGGLLAIVLVGEDGATEGPYYLQGPVTQAPDWAEVSKNLELAELIGQAQRAQAGV